MPREREKILEGIVRYSVKGGIGCVRPSSVLESERNATVLHFILLYHGSEAKECNE